MTKKILVGLAIATLLPVMASAATVDELQAQINALMAQLAASKTATTPSTSASCSFVFTKALKKGMSDVEVMNLQKVLNQSADTQVAASGVGSVGNETMYFGGATKAAVVAFQNKFAADILTPSGLTTGTGMVGAATRAKLNAICSGTVAATPTTPAGTTPVATVTGLQGAAGSANTTITTVDTDTTVKQGSSAKVLGFKVEATDSDLNVSNIKVTLVNNDLASSNRLTRYAGKVTVYMNGTAVGTANVADFTRNNDNSYTKSIALTNAIVKMGSGNKATFHVGIDALTNLDSGDANTNNWYIGASEIRYNDATGVTLTDGSTVTINAAGTLITGPLVKNFSFQKLNVSGDVKLTLTSGSANPVAQNVKVSETSQTKGVVLNELRLKAEGSPITFNNVQVQLNGSLDLGTMANTLYFMKGSQQLGSVSMTALVKADGTAVALAASTSPMTDTYTIKLDSDYTIAQDNTDTFQIVADLNKEKVNGTVLAYAQGSSITASIPTLANGAGFNPTDVNGDKVTTNLAGSSIGNMQTLYTQGIQASGFSKISLGSANDGTSNKPSGTTYTYSYHLKAFGNTYYIPKTAVQTTLGTNGLSFDVLKAGSIVTTGVSVVPGSITSSANTVTNGSGTQFFVVNDGEDQTFTVSITLDPMASGTPGMYSIQLNSAGYSIDETLGNVKAYAFAPVQNFRTDEANVTSY
jgi:hypothetical protein